MESYLNVDNMRIEIAVLQEEVNAYTPSKGKFRIPALMTEDVVANIKTSNSNIINRRNGNIGSSGVNINNYIELQIPFEYSFSYGASNRKIPKGTKFLVAFIGANVNDAKIIGRYNDPMPELIETLSKWIIEIIELDKREKTIVDHSDNEDAKIRSELDLNVGNINRSLSEKYDDSLNRVNDLNNRTTESINSLRASLEEKITTAESRFNVAIANLEESQNRRITALDESLSQKITNTNAELNNFKDRHNSDMSELRTSFEQSQSDQNNTINKKIDDSVNDLTDRIDSIDVGLR